MHSDRHDGFGDGDPYFAGIDAAAATSPDQPHLERYDELRSVDELPSCFQCVFPSFRYFNPVQSECFDVAFKSSCNMVVAAPTGSGKTVVMELAVLQLLMHNVLPNGEFSHNPGRLRVVYIAPTRSLVQEKVRDWTSRLQCSLGVQIRELTGDVDMMEGADIETADVICATPEKFDSVTRKHRDSGGLRFFGEIALVLIDEVHLLNESRGSVLEAGVVSRVKIVGKMKEVEKLPIANVRFVAVSATIPNASDLAEWLMVPSEGLRVYGEEVRPVKLHTIIKGYAPTKNDFLFERRLNDYIFGVISENSKGRPTLVFCSSRKGTFETASKLCSQSAQWSGNRLGGVYVRDSGHLERLRAAARHTLNKQLQQTLPFAVAFHHGGLDACDRSLVESLFLNQDVLVLCTTATLAMGVNLPAHLVVLKGTRRYCGVDENPGEGRGYKEYEKSTCLQMVGRAGRPQFDTEGVAVIMTQKQNVNLYENLLNGAEEVDSQLVDCLPEHLNAEIALRTITDVSMAIEWLKSTFLYVRVCKQPGKYGLPCSIANQRMLERYLEERLIITNVNKLAHYGMVKYDEYGFSLEPQETGNIMARYYIRFQTMINMTQAPSHTSIPDLIMTMASAEEFSNISLRRGEKKVLNGINCLKDEGGVKYRVMDASKPNKLKERISTPQEKIFVLINEALSDCPSDTLDASLRQETSQILKTGEQVAQAMSRYFPHRQHLAATANALLLRKCLKLRIWDGSMRQARQLPNIGKLLSERLAAAGLGTLHALGAADPRRIETVTMKNYPFGNQIKQELRNRLPPSVSLEIQPLERIGKRYLRFEVKLARVVQGREVVGATNYAWLIAGTIHNDKLLLHERVFIEKFPSPYQVKAVAEIPSENGSLDIVASIIHENIIGVDITKKLVLPPNAPLHAIQPSKEPDTTAKIGNKPLVLSSSKSAHQNPPMDCPTVQVPNPPSVIQPAEKMTKHGVGYLGAKARQWAQIPSKCEGLKDQPQAPEQATGEEGVLKDIPPGTGGYTPARLLFSSDTQDSNNSTATEDPSRQKWNQYLDAPISACRQVPKRMLRATVGQEMEFSRKTPQSFARNQWDCTTLDNDDSGSKLPVENLERFRHNGGVRLARGQPMQQTGHIRNLGVDCRTPVRKKAVTPTSASRPVNLNGLPSPQLLPQSKSSAPTLLSPALNVLKRKAQKVKAVDGSRWVGGATSQYAPLFRFFKSVSATRNPSEAKEPSRSGLYHSMNSAVSQVLKKPRKAGSYAHPVQPSFQAGEPEDKCESSCSVQDESDPGQKPRRDPRMPGVDAMADEDCQSQMSTKQPFDFQDDKRDAKENGHEIDASNISSLFSFL